MTVTEPTDDIPVTTQPTSTQHNGGSTNTTTTATANATATSNEPKRRVSIASDPVMAGHVGGYDNLGYDLHSRRKVSQVRLVRRKLFRAVRVKVKHLGFNAIIRL